MNRSITERLEACVLCGGFGLHQVLDLGAMPILTPNAARPANVDEAVCSAGVVLDLYSCGTCGHVQIGSVGNPDVQYREYVYTTSLSVGLADHFSAYARGVVAELALPAGSLIVELGSNDGTLLRAFKALGMEVQGVDPARRIAEMASAAGVPTIAEFFSPAVADQIASARGPARVIIANNVIANIADMHDIGSAVARLLAADGTFIFETQYALDVVDRALLDTVYHEHISYFLVRPTRDWLRRFALDLADVLPIETKGGSIRAYARRMSPGLAASTRVAAAIAREEASGVFEPAYFNRLAGRISEIRAALHALVRQARGSGRPVAGFGVSVGTSTLLSQFGLEEAIDVLYDDDPNKAAFLTGPTYKIPVRHGSALSTDVPALVIVFAWRYLEPILAVHADYLAAGGTFVVPLPEVRVIARHEHLPNVVRA